VSTALSHAPACAQQERLLRHCDCATPIAVSVPIRFNDKVPNALNQISAPTSESTRDFNPALMNKASKVVASTESIAKIASGPNFWVVLQRRLWTLQAAMLLPELMELLNSRTTTLDGVFAVGIGRFVVDHQLDDLVSPIIATMPLPHRP